MAVGKVRKAFRWSAVGTVGTELIGMIFLVVLARLLTPEDYGLAAIVGTFLALGRVMTEAGFDRALVQSLHIDADDETTAFIANLVLGLLTSGLIILAAPAIAGFYAEPRLVDMLRVTALLPPVLAFALLQFAILERALDFRTRSAVDLGANLGAGLLAVGLALTGMGAWSLIGQFLAYAVLRVLLLGVLRPWWPRGRFSRDSLARMWGFSWRLGLGQFINTAFGQLHTLAIGRLFGLAEVGLYNRSKNLQAPLTSALSAIVSKVSFSAFARMQAEPERLRHAFRRVLRVLTGVSAAVMCGIAGVAWPLVEVVLSPRWAEAAPLLQAFAVFGLTQGLVRQYSVLAQALGRTGLILGMNILQHSLSIGLLVLTWRWGVFAVVAGLALRSCLTLAVWCWLARGLTGYRLRDQVADIAPPVLVGLLAGVVAQAAISLIEAPALVELMCAVVAGTGAWMAAALLLRRSAFADVYDEALRILGRKGGKTDRLEGEAASPPRDDGV